MLAIRKAELRDVTLMLSFIRELALYERDPSAVVATEADLARDLDVKFHCLIAEWSGEPAGFAFYFHNYSTWQGRWGLYLEDLFVRPALRGNGIGKALLGELARIAVQSGCGRFVWQVLDWNEPALRFYEKLGARRLGEWVTMRLEGEALTRLANG